jgi:hypothetical protein
MGRSMLSQITASTGSLLAWKLGPGNQRPRSRGGRGRGRVPPVIGKVVENPPRDHPMTRLRGQR